MSERMIIESSSGPYSVAFAEQTLEEFDATIGVNHRFIVDARVAAIYAEGLKNVLALPSTLVVEATEENKSLENLPIYVEHLADHKTRRDHELIAIGGGIIQDITCFLASTFLRGLTWHFVPTTLLSQADSCIGSKSSLNCGKVKNVVGTFLPPRTIKIMSQFWDTLSDLDIRSGIGEILKVHAVNGRQALDEITNRYDDMVGKDPVLMSFIHRSLEIKKAFVEKDEFDRNVRNVLNYGHTFGHALESATNFAIPHGIAVTIGMDMANFVAGELGVGDAAYFRRNHPLLKRNFEGFEQLLIPQDDFISAISKDKKNVGSTSVTLILPDKNGELKKDRYENDERFRKICKDYLQHARAG